MFFFSITYSLWKIFQRWNFRWNIRRWFYFFWSFVLGPEVFHNLVQDEDLVVKNLEVSHFDCGTMTQNTFYAPNQVWENQITPEELEISQTEFILFTKQFRKELNATKCRKQRQRKKWHCWHNNHSSIYRTIGGTTGKSVISPEQNRSLTKGKMINLADQFLEVEHDTENPI